MFSFVIVVISSKYVFGPLVHFICRGETLLKVVITSMLFFPLISIIIKVFIQQKRAADAPS